MPGDLQYTTINDFRPGIITNQRQISASRLTLPAGAADTGTFDCIANATGQLVPLPLAVKTVNDLTLNGTPAFGINPQVIGLAVEGTTGYLHVAVEYVKNNAGNHQQVVEWWYYYQPNAAWVLIKTMNGVSTATNNATFNSLVGGRISRFVQTRGRRATFSSPGFPIVAFEWTSFDTQSVPSGPWYDGAIYFYEIFPDPNALGVDGTFEETGAVNNAGLVFGGPILAHSGRIIRLCETFTAHGSQAPGFTTNERVRYTDPPNSVSLTPTTTDSILDPQYPGGFGAWGSISFGELILIKRYGGGLLVEGDIYAPQVTRLPGLKGVGPQDTQVAFSNAGLVYASYRDGVYLWNGGNTSQKINKVDDNFAVGAFNPGVSASLATWGGDQIAFSNGYLYDTLNDAWWLQSTPADTSIGLVASSGGTDLFVTTNQIKPATTKTFEFYQYQKGGNPVSAYTWQSQPIQVSVDKTIDIREVIISLTNVRVTAAATATVVFQALDGPSATETWALAQQTQRPVILRKPIGIRGNSIRITFSVTTDAGHPAPNLNSISFGWKEAGPLGQVQ